MTTIIPMGRMGNQLIRNIAVSILAEKFNLKVKYSSVDKLNLLGIQLFNGAFAFKHTIPLHDDNYFSIYHSDSLYSNVDPTTFFQIKEISIMIYDYLRREDIKKWIMAKNPYITRYHTNNDVYVHIRLTDVAHCSPGFAYYKQAIETISYDKLYFSTDDPTHEIIIQFMNQFPHATRIDDTEVATMQFASTCRHVVLSHGSFSAMIGYLSFFSIVHYPEYEVHNMWFGDMFSIPSWIKHGSAAS
jgi:hypothetical protein